MRAVRPAALRVSQALSSITVRVSLGHKIGNTNFNFGSATNWVDCPVLIGFADAPDGRRG